MSIYAILYLAFNMKQFPDLSLYFQEFYLKKKVFNSEIEN